MTGNTTILVSVILFSIVLIAWLVLRPSITATRGGKMLAFVALLIFSVLAGGMGVSKHIEHSKTTNFCLSVFKLMTYGSLDRRDVFIQFVVCARLVFNFHGRQNVCAK